MTLNDGQNIVKVVRHAAGELANGLHLLRLPKLGFQQNPLGNIFGIAIDKPAVGI